MSRRIEINLRDIAAETDFLPELAEVWEEEPDLNRDVWYFEWQELMARLEGLDEAYQSGSMIPDQRRRYEDLRCKLKEALPILKRLDLPLPSIPLEP